MRLRIVPLGTSSLKGDGEESTAAAETAAHASRMTQNIGKQEAHLGRECRRVGPVLNVT